MPCPPDVLTYIYTKYFTTCTFSLGEREPTTKEVQNNKYQA